MISRLEAHDATEPDTANDSIVAVVNPASGSAISSDDLRDAFSRLGVRVSWKETTEDDPGAGQAAEAVESGARTVIACGGDGTVRACLAPLAGTDVALGIVPLGTGNLLASNLGVDAGLDSVGTALDGAIRTIDLAEVNGETFAVMAGSGFDALMIRDANSDTKRRFGSAAYVVSAARNLPAQLVPTTVEVDGARVYEGRTAMVLVGNCGAVTGGLEVFPDAVPDDGVLDVAILAARSPMEWASVLWRLVRGLPQRTNLVERFRGRSVKIHTASPRPYELDGEDRPAADTLELSVRPRALHVRVPAEAALSGPEGANRG
jgi:diacylglycerol kinase (ATP)